MMGLADASANKLVAATVPSVQPATHTSFSSIKQINAGLLNVGYAEAGPADGPPVVLLHGWPYDIYSYVRRSDIGVGGLQGHRSVYARLWHNNFSVK